MIRRARALVADDRKHVIDLLNARRQLLGEHLHRYQQFKHGRIFDPVVQHGPPSSKVVARTMKLDCMEMGAAFGDYCTRWLQLREAEWPMYRHDMLDTMDTLVGHLEAELRAMRQLLMISDFYRR